MSRQAFDAAIAFILPHEEEFARGHWGDEAFVIPENVAGDSGGLTKYGIDHASHPGVDIAGLTKSAAIEIYWQLWQSHNLDALPDQLAILAMDVWVNGGHADLWLQEAYNSVRGHGDLPWLKEDGVLGPVSLAALNAPTCDIPGMVESFIAERNAHFREIATSERAKFLPGWLERDHDLEQLLRTYTPAAA